jgi:hypothetical protein
LICSTDKDAQAGSTVKAAIAAIAAIDFSLDHKVA